MVNRKNVRLEIFSNASLDARRINACYSYIGEAYACISFALWEGMNILMVQVAFFEENATW